MPKVFKYADNVDTDIIIPARYLANSNGEVLKNFCMTDIDPNFAKNVRLGDIIVGGENFGCGSSREHAPMAIKSCGISCIIAKSFARIFYRNCINIGLPILECFDAAEKTDKNDELQIDFNTGKIFNKTKNETYQAEPFPQFIQNIIKSGNLLNFLKQNKI